MKKLILLIIFIFLQLIYQPAFSRSRNSTKIGHAFGAAGLAIGLGSVRIGRHSWEVGLLNSYSFGVCKLLNVGNSLYFGFGFALMNEIGVYGSAGFEFWDYKFINARFEINGTSTIGNSSHGELLLGVSINI